jgi:hypothetical protein
MDTDHDLSEKSTMVGLSISGVGMWLMAGFLGLAAVAQLNDPQPAIWTTFYALPCALTVWGCLTNAESIIWRAMCRYSLIAMAPFAGLVVYTALEESSLEKLLTSEEGRESAGVLIVVFWLILLLLYDKDRRGGWLDHGLLVFAVVPFSAWIVYKLYIQHTLTLPDHCEGMI